MSTILVTMNHTLTKMEELINKLTPGNYWLTNQWSLIKLIPVELYGI